MVQKARKTLVVTFLILLCPVASYAQDSGSAAAAQSGPRSDGPMSIQRIESGFMIAPDFKITEFDDNTSMLAGFYGGLARGQDLLRWRRRLLADQRFARPGPVLRRTRARLVGPRGSQGGFRSQRA